MRILQIHNRYRQDGGEDTVVDSEARVLRAAGHEVIQHIVRNPEDSLKSAMTLSLSAWNPISARRIATLVSRVRPDITHVHNTWFQLSSSVLTAIRAAGSPLVVTLHNYRSVCANAILLRQGTPCQLCLESRSSWPAMRHRCYRDSAVASAAAAAAIATGSARGVWRDAPDLLMPVSAFVREKLILGGLPANKMIVNHHFASDPRPRKCAPTESNSVMYVGRLSQEKGINLLLEAWENGERGALTLDVVGEGAASAALLHSSDTDINFLGLLSREALQEKMLGARALVVPSLSYESFGMVLVEAMAAGLPVIASEIGAIPEVLGPWPKEFLVPPNSTHALAAGLESLHNETLLDSTSRSGRKRYEEAFTPAAGLRALEEAYQQAIVLRG